MIRGFGIIAASFSRNSSGSKHTARVPSPHTRRKRTSSLPSFVSSKRSCARLNLEFYAIWRADNKIPALRKFIEIVRRRSTEISRR